MTNIYILHFDKPIPYAHFKYYGDPKHYVGKTLDPIKRFADHAMGKGSKMTKAAKRWDIRPEVVAIFSGPQCWEKRVIKYGPRLLCCRCNPIDGQMDYNPYGSLVSVLRSNDVKLILQI